MTNDDALRLLRRKVDQFPTMTQAAFSWGVSLSLLCDVLHGRRAVAGKLLEVVGLAREVRVVRRKTPVQS